MGKVLAARKAEDTERASGSQEADGRKLVLSQRTSAGTALVGGRMVTSTPTGMPSVAIQEGKAGGRQPEEESRAWG